MWRLRSPGKVTVSVLGTGRTETVVAPAGPASVTIGGLEPSRLHTAEVSAALDDGSSLSTRVPFRTLDRPVGPPRCRIATLSDLHIGLHEFGLRRTIHEPRSTGERVMVRCGRMALAEAVAWGADLIVVKGDLTNSGRRYEWQQAAALLGSIEVPVVVLPGNHEVSGGRSIESWQAAAELGLHVVRDVEHIDLPGIRAVLATTAIPGRSRGRLDHRREAVVAGAAGGPAALVMLHHQLERHPDPPLWPPGIRRGEAERFLDELGAAQPRSLVTSGHTHRLRRRQHGPVTVGQVGSTKDHPGVWAGYTVHDDGLTQVVHRIADPECLAWTDRTRRALGGLWGPISIGRLEDRCFTLTWPAGARPVS